MLKKHSVLPGIIISLSLLVIATFYYPGGSQFDKSSVGYDWKNNYISNLFGEKAINGAFDKVLQSLNSLSEIQAKEGNQIFKISSLNINGTIIMSQLEIALLLILGIFALVLVSANDNKLLQMQNPRLN